MASRRDELDTNLYQAVLMDHEYEFYRPWNDFMEGVIYPDVGDHDQVHYLEVIDADVENEVETAQESRIVHHLARNGIDLEIPPSPATASLQELLQQAYRETQVEAQDIIPYEEHQTTTMNEQRDGKGLNLDILDEMETIISSPHQISFSEITSSESSISNGIELYPPITSSTSSMRGHATRSDFYNNLIENPYERRDRFKSGLKYIEAKVKRMRLRTGATAAGIAEYESEQYCFETCSNSFRVREIESWEARLPGADDGNVSEIPAKGDDHRYAAQIVTQSSSSATVSDHQYENRGFGARDALLGNQEVNIHSQSSDSTPAISKPSFEKRTYERNKSFQRHVHVLFSEVIKKLEQQTGTTISLRVSYQDEVFTKLNYEDARHIFEKRVRNGLKIPPVPISKTSRKNYKESPRSSSTASVREISLPDISHQSSPMSSVTNPNPHCLRCNSSTLLTEFGKTDDGFIGWVRCSDPLCSYLVHATCLGFLVTSKNSLRRLPPFFCEAHRD